VARSPEPANASLDRRAARGTLWVGLGSWLNRLVLVAVLGVLATRLSARELGILSVAGVCSNALTILGSLGLADALVYQRGRVSAAARTALTLAGVLGLVIGGALLVAAPAVAAFFRVPEAAPIIRAYGLMLPLDIVKQVPFAVLTRELAFNRRFVPEVLPRIIAGGVTIGLALGGVGVWSFVIGDAITSGLSLLLCFAVLPERFGFGWHPDLAVGLWRYGKHIVATQGFDFALQNIDYVLVGRLLGPVALGFYSLAFRIAILPFLTITYVIAGVTFPYFARLAPDWDRIRGAFRSTFGVAMAIVCLFGGGVIALAPSLEVLGTRWAPSVPAARALGVYVCLRSAAHLMHALLAAVGRPGVDAFLRGVWFVLLGVLIATVGRRGIVTVALLQAGVAAVLLGGYVAAASRLVGLSAPRLLLDLGRQAAAVAAATLAVAGVRLLGGVWDNNASWETLLLLGSVFVLAYAAACLLLLPGIVADLRRVRASLA
jgi:O-antigen/teichoic acid export membrane protein